MKMKLMGGVALAAVVVASGALASENGWYGAVDAGGHEARNITATSPNSPSVVVKTRDSVVGFGRLGYRFSPYIRMEVEGGYRPGDLKGVSSRGALPNYLCNESSTFAYGDGVYSGTCGRPSGEVDAWSAMANLLVDVMPHSRVSPFFGGGVGAVFLHARGHGNLVGPGALGGSEAAGLSGSPTVLGYQGIGGVSFAVSNRLDIDLTYHYLATERGSVTFTSASGGPQAFHGRYQDQAVTLGLRYAFASPAAPPPPPPPPPPPAPEAAPQIGRAHV